MKKISIIIVTYNSERDIFGCLESIYSKNDLGDELEVIIVDNNSENQTTFCENIRETYPDVYVIENTENLGYGAGNNIGIKAASSEIILVMNPDVRIRNMSFSNIYNSYRDDCKLGLLGFTQYETLEKRGRSFLPLFISIKHLVIFRFYLHLNRFNYKYLCFSGACFSFRKKTLSCFGFFDANNFLYGEERYIHLKIMQNKNFKILYDSKHSYIHPMSHRAFDEKKSKLAFRSYINTAELFKIDLKKVLLDYYRVMYLFFLKNVIFSPSIAKENKNMVRLVQEYMSKKL